MNFLASQLPLSTGWLSLITAILVVIGHALSMAQRQKIKSNTDGKLAEVHVLVNSRLTDALDRIAALELALGIKPDAPIPPPVKRDNYE